MDNITNNKLAKEFTIKELIKFSLPSIVMMLCMSAYTIVDGIFVARFVGTDALSALNIVYPLVGVAMAIAIMFATGGAAIVSKQMGENEKDKANNSFSIILYTMLAICFILVALSLIFLDDIILLLGASEDLTLLPLCRAYLIPMLIVAPLAMLQALFQTFFVVAGRPTIGFGLTALAGVVNIILDYVFMGPMQMGIIGASLGTAIGMTIPSIVGIIFFIRNKNGLHLLFKPKFNSKVIMKACTNGSSEMVTNLSASVVTVLFNLYMMKTLGSAGVSAITIVGYTQFLLNALYFGFSIGIAPIISYHFGAQNNDYLKKLVKMCVKFTLISAIFIFVISISSAKLLAQVFATEGSEVYTIAVRGLMLVAPAYIFSGINILASGTYTALSDGLTSAIISFSRTLVFTISSLFLLTYLLGSDGLFLSLVVAEILSIILVGLITFYKVKKKSYILK